MPRPRPPHLHRETNRHGTTVWYVRLGKGRRIRIKAAYGTPEFEAAYQAALRGELPLPATKAPKGSLEWLWILYRQTSAWSDLSLATRKQRERIMRQVLATGGAQPLSNITPRAIQLGIERRKSFAARHFVDTLRGMFKWAVAAEHVRSDPTAGKAVPKAKSKGFPVWTEGDLEQFERRWPIGTRERVMFDVYLYTGLRRGDVAKLGKQHIDRHGEDRNARNNSCPAGVGRDHCSRPHGRAVDHRQQERPADQKRSAWRLVQECLPSRRHQQIGPRDSQGRSDASREQWGYGGNARGNLRVGRREDGLALYEGRRPSRARCRTHDETVQNRNVYSRTS
ncbi:hypothetical protein ACVWXL_004103 [Bradyrhizobium sp. GM22.5]